MEFMSGWLMDCLLLNHDVTRSVGVIGSLKQVLSSESLKKRKMSEDIQSWLKYKNAADSRVIKVTWVRLNRIKTTKKLGVCIHTWSPYWDIHYNHSFSNFDENLKMYDLFPLTILRNKTSKCIKSFQYVCVIDLLFLLFNYFPL